MNNGKKMGAETMSNEQLAMSNGMEMRVSPVKVMSNEQRTEKKENRREIREMENEVLGMSGEKKSCVDCLYCKVSAKSTKNNRLIYCAETKKKENHKEPYWLVKTVCKKFEDMTA
jgi:hypothetical protein